MQTNLAIDAALVNEALKISGSPAPEAVVEEALKQFIRLRKQTRFRELFGKIPIDLDLDASRRD